MTDHADFGKRRWRSLRAALVLAFWLPVAAWAQESETRQVVMSIEDARQVAANAMVAGDFELALAIAQSLIERDPDDHDALMQATAALIALGRFDEAAVMARRAWRAARNDAERVNAARLAASAQFKAGRHLRAEIWLRRGFNRARDLQTQNVLRQEFRQVRAENPFTATLGFSLAPNDNVNNGSSARTVLIWNLPFVLSPDARALSGIEAAANIGLKYRLSRSEMQQTHLALALYGRTYELSKAAKTAAPGVKGSDYAFAMAELTLTHDRRFKAFPGPTSFALTAGKYWYGGEPYISYQRGQVAQGFEISDRLGANLKLGFETQVSHLAGGVESQILSVGGGVTFAVGERDSLSVELLASDTQSQDITAENRAIRAQVVYGLGAPVLGAQVAFSLAAEKRDFPFSVYDPSGRHDLSLSAGLNLTFPEITYYGFSPTVSLETSRTESNVSLFDRESTGIRFGIQSTF